MDRAAKRELRRRQIERFFATDDMTIAQWCKLNKISESTFYKWAAVFRKEEPELFDGRARRTSDWIEVSREEVRNSVALATIPDSIAAPASESIAKEPINETVSPSITAIVNDVIISVPDGASESTIAAVLRAAATL